MKVNVFKHELVPAHRILSEEEKKELLKKYGVTPAKLPKILSIDPVAKALGAKVGDVIEITRKSPTAGEAKYYRLVVKGKF
jgi:DNA-directed RNA polymerase subunit H